MNCKIIRKSPIILGIRNNIHNRARIANVASTDHEKPILAAKLKSLGYPNSGDPSQSCLALNVPMGEGIKLIFSIWVADRDFDCERHKPAEAGEDKFDYISKQPANPDGKKGTAAIRQSDSPTL